MKPVHIAFVLLIDLLWAFNIVAIKEAVLLMAPLLTVALRYGVVLLVCASSLKIVPGRMGLVLATGVITGAIQFGLGAYSYQVATNLSALAIAGQLGVPLSLILAILIDGERIAWRRTVGILLAIAGVALLVFDPRIVDERLGIFLTFGASFCWAIGNLMFRRLTGVPVLTLYGWQAVVSIPLLLAASWFLEPGGIAALPHVPLMAFGWVVYSAIAASLVGHAGMSWLLQRYPVTLITPFTLPTPMLAVGIATLYYGTPVTPLMWVGGALTLTGVAIITLRSARKSVEADA
ncbi:DMT family transporter [Sandaracinobacter sp. RS1-74]|uniref:DMT family transporter n=1 Tax=Sandaracinobacteroides sayramensis TaxID=2913411 RepID=UPI001EDA44A5|nr:DMT family transporter [Sandaracinobacteroides sayramensis]MCG2841730.1 DMT family transporter [Sandaracinobacteroides sayramensis]